MVEAPLKVRCRVSAERTEVLSSAEGAEAGTMVSSTRAILRPQNAGPLTECSRLVGGSIRGTSWSPNKNPPRIPMGKRQAVHARCGAGRVVPSEPARDRLAAWRGLAEGNQSGANFGYGSIMPLSVPTFDLHWHFGSHQKNVGLGRGIQSQWVLQAEPGQSQPQRAVGFCLDYFSVSETIRCIVTHPAMHPA